MTRYSGNTTGNGGKVTRRGTIAAKFAMTTPKRTMNSREGDGDDGYADFHEALNDIHRRAVERATKGLLTVVGDRIISA